MKKKKRRKRRKNIKRNQKRGGKKRRRKGIKLRVKKKKRPKKNPLLCLETSDLKKSLKYRLRNFSSEEMYSQKKERDLLLALVIGET